MSAKKITFTIKSIDESGSLELTIESAELETKEGKKAVEKIIFAIPPSERGDLKNILESKKSDGTENKEFELKYDDEDLEVEEGSTLHFASMSSGSEKAGSRPKTKHKLDDKTLKIWEVNLITLTVKGEQEQQTDDQNNKKSGDADKKALIEKNIQAIKNKLQASGITSQQEIDILGNTWETDYKMSEATDTVEEIEGFKNERIATIEEWIAKNKESQDDQQDQTPKEPTKEEIDEATKKLKNAKSEEELEEALKNARDTANNSPDEELKRQKEEKERELGEKNPQKSREIIRDEVNSILQENEISAEDLSPSVKQKYDELNNNNIETAQAQTIRTEIFDDLGEKALKKLIAALEQALKDRDSNKIKSQSKKLQEFSNSQIDYKKSAFEKERDKVQQLLDQAKNYSGQENNKGDGFFRLNNPLMWVSGVAVVGVLAGAILIVRSHGGEKN